MAVRKTPDGGSEETGIVGATRRSLGPQKLVGSIVGIEIVLVGGQQMTLAATVLATTALAIVAGLVWTWISLLAATRTDVDEWRIDGWRRTPGRREGGDGAGPSTVRPHGRHRRDRR